MTTGYDAFQGWNNSDKYFGGDKETNSTEKKLASALTNIVDMGGLTTSIFKFFGSDFDTKAVAQKMFGWIDGIQSWWNEKIMPALTKIWESISRIGASIWKVVKPIWETLHTMVNKLFEFGKNVLAVDIEYWSNIISTIGDVLGWLVNTLSSGVEWIAEGFEDFVNVGGEIIEWFKSLPETIMNAIGNLFGVDNLYKTVADTVGGWFNSLIDGVTGYFKEKWPILAKAASSIGSWFSSSDKKEQKEQKEVEEQLVKIKTKTSEVTEDISKGRGAGYGMHNGTRDNALPIEEEAGKLSVAISNKIHYDCSQWVSALLTNMGQEGFVDKNGNALSSKAIKNKLLAKNGGLEKNWKDAKEGDVIYLNDANGQDYGTTHVAMVYKDPETGELMVTESNGKQGVTTKSYAEYQKLYGNRMHLLNNTDDPSKIQQVAYSTNKQAIDRRYNNNIIGDEKRQEVVVNNINANDNKNINNNNSSNTGGNNITPIMVVNPVPTFSYYGGLNPRV